MVGTKDRDPRPNIWNLKWVQANIIFSGVPFLFWSRSPIFRICSYGGCPKQKVIAQGQIVQNPFFHSRVLDPIVVCHVLLVPCAGLIIVWQLGQYSDVDAHEPSDHITITYNDLPCGNWILFCFLFVLLLPRGTIHPRALWAEFVQVTPPIFTTLLHPLDLEFSHSIRLQKNITSI